MEVSSRIILLSDTRLTVVVLEALFSPIGDSVPVYVYFSFKSPVPVDGIQLIVYLCIQCSIVNVFLHCNL